MVYDHVAGTLSALDREVVAAVPPGGNWRDLPANFASKRIEQIRRSVKEGKGSRSTYYGRLRWDRPAYTISTYFSRPGNGCFIHPAAARLITVREAARLQSFPDSYRFSGAGRARFVQVGNAVPPLLAYQLAMALPKGSMVDLFAGAGGLSLGMEMAGHSLLAAVDYDAAAVAAFRRNRSDPERAIKANLSDPDQYRTVMAEVQRRAGHDGVQLLVGGPPCQGFSSAGDNLLDDPRNRLVYVFLEAVRSLRPKFVLMENVPALMWRRGKAVLDEVREALRSSGYATSVAIAHAEGYGVPQLRRRLFLLAGPKDELRWPSPWRSILPPSSPQHQPGMAGDSHLPAPVTVQEALGDLPLETSASADAAVEYRVAAGTPFQRWVRGEMMIRELIPPAAIVEESAPVFSFATL